MFFDYFIHAYNNAFWLLSWPSISHLPQDFQLLSFPQVPFPISCLWVFDLLSTKCVIRVAISLELFNGLGWTFRSSYNFKKWFSVALADNRSMAALRRGRGIWKDYREPEATFEGNGHIHPFECRKDFVIHHSYLNYIS